MNGYKMILAAILVLILAAAYNLEPAIQRFFNTIADIPSFNPDNLDDVENPALFTLGVRLCYLIAIIGLAKLFFNRKRNDE